MGRAALDWTTRDLAAKAGVGVNTVTRFERGDDTRAATEAAIRTALEAAGVVFIPENGGGPGVRLSLKGDNKDD
ncbi:Helix-turn-helix [Rhodospira trueperi]|uniref:Helix-turn-helix n=2 Tax=Rhodospira trueperi TaxID=69960 RepID=A0A1G7BEQ6_9PROT|nr:Helix-turn-helix [Rhodospira trueperi]